MRAHRSALSTLAARLSLVLLMLGLFCRTLVPAGFMPDAGQHFAITLCVDGAAMPAWIDRDGVAHKGEHQPAKSPDHPCAFAGFGAALDSPPVLAAAFIARAAIAAAVVRPAHAVSVGRGLAAPPPPATGPPTFA